MTPQASDLPSELAAPAQRALVGVIYPGYLLSEVKDILMTQQPGEAGATAGSEEDLSAVSS